MKEFLSVGQLNVLGYIEYFGENTVAVVFSSVISDRRRNRSAPANSSTVMIDVFPPYAALLR